ncbi:MAG: hypothetical protein LBI04_03855 [Treponema sp.]|jgi:hypothetical protein|nr:hypothetical protein [Treponema sp.]
MAEMKVYQGKNNMVQKNNCIIFALPVLLVLLLTACATTIRLEVQRPPALNTAGIKRIAIMTFEAASNNSVYREMAQYAATAATINIKALNYFTLVDPSEIERLRRSNQSIENYVDALFVGRITRVDAMTEAQQGSYKTKDGKTVYYTDYVTNVEIEFNYSLTRSRDGSVIGPVFKKDSNRSSDRENYPSASMLLRAVVDRQLKYLGRDVAPYTAIENRALAKDKSKDKILQAEMKDALARVKEGSYRTALEAYLGIYERYKSFAAAENASVLYEAFGETKVAANFMQQVFDETGNPKAREVLARLNRILQDQAMLASDYDNSRSQTDRVAALASSEVQNVLPKDARVWIYNDVSANPMTTAVADNITSDFIRKGIGVVDRQNAKLIEAEQEFQMSGYVSDDDFLSIGNAAGANIIVVIGIIGTGAMRRLQVRVLDIERRVPIMQSDTSEKWQL